MKNILLLLLFFLPYTAFSQITAGQHALLISQNKHQSEQVKMFNEPSEVEFVLDSTYRYYYEEDVSEYELQGRILYQYNETGFETEECYQAWYNDAQSWSECSYYNSFYDGEGNIIEYTYKYWHPIDEIWTYDYRSLYTYADGQLIILLDQEWDPVNQVWIDDSRLLYEYDQYGNTNLVTYQRWNYETSDVWTNIWKYATEDLNEENLPAEQVFYRWNNPSMEWDPEWRSLYTYDDSGNITAQINQEWNLPMNDWFNDYRYLDTYVDGYRIESLRQDWNGMDWYDYWRRTYTYDEHHNLTSEIAEEFTINGLELSWKEEFSYDEDDNQIQKLGFSYTTITEEWLPGEREDYYWRPFVTAVPELSENQIECRYPNPFYDGATIQCEVDRHGNYYLRIYDGYGRIVLDQAFNEYTEQLGSKDLASGTYIIIISDKNEVLYRDKLVVIR